MALMLYYELRCFNINIRTPTHENRWLGIKGRSKALTGFSI
jgi:hypothetical protein